MTMSFDVVIADDSALSRRFVRQCLEIAGLEGCRFLEARNGEEAWKILKSEAAVKIVFTDLNMPVLDGEKLLEKVKSDPTLGAVKIVVVTSAQSELRRQALRDAGACAVLGKPLTPAAMATTLSALKEELGL